MYRDIQVSNPFLLGETYTANMPTFVMCKGGGKSSSAYDRELAEQRAAREKAEREAETLRQNQENTFKARKKRGQASFLTPGEGEGDENITTGRKSVLGPGAK